MSEKEVVIEVVKTTIFFIGVLAMVFMIITL